MPTYKSNTKEIINALLQDFGVAADPTKISRVGSEQLVGDMINRIHQKGLNAANGKIGNYSAKPMYVSLTSFVRKKGQVGKGSKLKNGTRPAIKGQRVLKARGKHENNPKFKNGKPRKSRYFGAGYKEYHEEMGNGSNVNLTLSGQLANDFRISPIGRNFGLGFSGYGSPIYKGLENHFSALIWSPSPNERKRVNVAVEKYIHGKL